MNVLTNRIAKLAASAVLLGTIAYGQSPIVKATIPFDFRTSTGTLPAGVYTIKSEPSGGSANVTSLRNEATQHTVFTVRIARDFNLANAGKSSVIFLCGEDGCALSGLRTSDGSTSYYPNRQSKHDKEVAIVAVPIRSIRAD